jgi:hypothetical protein
MPHERREHLLEAEIDGWLTTLGMASHGQWDVPVLLYRDQTRLVAALDILECPGLVERARRGDKRSSHASRRPGRGQSRRGGHDPWRQAI